MAKFYRPRGHAEPAVLWDPKADKPVYEFFGGVFETDDPETIAKMRELGFTEEPISSQNQVVMEVTKDVTRPPAPPPPSEKSVPAIEPAVNISKGRMGK